MNSSIKTTLAITLALVTLFNLNGQTQDVKGNKVPADYFTGTVWLKPLANDTPYHCTMARVTFEPGARSNWHTHPDKQIVIVAEGVGYLKVEKGVITWLRRVTDEEYSNNK